MSKALDRFMQALASKQASIDGSSETVEDLGASLADLLRADGWAGDVAVRILERTPVESGMLEFSISYSEPQTYRVQVEVRVNARKPRAEALSYRVALFAEPLSPEFTTTSSGDAEKAARKVLDAVYECGVLVLEPAKALPRSKDMQFGDLEQREGWSR